MKKDAIVRILHEQNFRLTREREALLDHFMQADRMMTPAQWHEFTQQQQVRVGLTTVYRLLEVLTKVGLATPFLVDGSIYYTFCADHHHHHFVCLQCHRVENIYECPVIHSVPEGCQIHHHKLDLYGECAHCRTASPHH